MVYVRGGHDHTGNESAPLDRSGARRHPGGRETVEAFAVSGYFSVLNTSHENRVRDLVEELTGLPVTCGHELSSRLNSVQRATTTALNAHLILPLRELIAAVRHILVQWNITAPLMIVKGDGSLMRAEWAEHRPIKTILSGPAASVVGAWHLAQTTARSPARQPFGWSTSAARQPILRHCAPAYPRSRLRAPPRGRLANPGRSHQRPHGRPWR